MATLDWHKGIQIVTPDPTGAGGLAIQNDLIKLVDWSPESKWDATGDPAGSDNSDHNYYPGSFWLNVSATPPKLFVLKSEAVVGPDKVASWQQVQTQIEIVQDTSPQLGGDLDVNGKVITSASNGSVVISPNGTGSVGIGTSPAYFVHAKRDVNSKVQSVVENASTGSTGQTEFTAVSNSSRSVAMGIESTAMSGKAYIASPNADLQLRMGGATQALVKSSNGQMFLGDTTNTAARGLSLNIEKNVPGFMFYAVNDTASNVKAWDFFAFDGVLQFRCVNDAVNAATTWLRLDRSGQTPTLLTLSVPMTHQQTSCPNNAGTLSGSTMTFDLSKSDVHNATLSANLTLAVTGVRVGQRFIVTLKQDTAGSRTVTWWAGVSWPGGTTPTLTTTASKSDAFEFVCTNTLGGNTFLGRVWGQNY